MSARRARKLLGVKAGASAGEVRAAWAEAAKAVHPDAGGDAERFDEVTRAYRLLRDEPAPPLAFPAVPAPERVRPPTLEITPQVAAVGGPVEAALREGRRVRVLLEAGMRAGDKVRAGGELLMVAIRGEGGAMVRGNDVWLSAKVAPAVLGEGGRIMVDTPLGRRIVWISRRAGARGLIRLAGQGLPARGGHAQGDLFLRLEAEAQPESAVRAHIRRFAAAWAA